MARTKHNLVITGEFLTQHARTMVLSEKHADAQRLLMDSLVGDGAADVVAKILVGQLNLTGDSQVGISTSDASDDADTQRYIDDVAYIYAGRVLIDGQWYRPMGVVFAYSSDEPNTRNFATQIDITAQSALARFACLRASYYIDSNMDERAFVLRLIDEDGIDSTLAHVVFEMCDDVPPWIEPAQDPQEALDKFIAAGHQLVQLRKACRYTIASEAEKMIMTFGLDEAEAPSLRDAAYAADDEKRELHMLFIGEQVRERVGVDVISLQLDDGRILSVPRAPFVRWALCRPGVEVGTDRIPAWVNIAQPGLKMCNDDPNHTDWVLGAGLTLDEAYSDAVQTAAWALAAEMQFSEFDDDRKS